MTGRFRKLQPSDGITSGDEYFMLEPVFRAVESSKFGDDETISHSRTSSFVGGREREAEESDVIKKGCRGARAIVRCWNKPGDICSLFKRDLRSKARGYSATRFLEPSEKSIAVQNGSLFSKRAHISRKKANRFGGNAKRDEDSRQATKVDKFSTSGDCNVGPASHEFTRSRTRWIALMAYLWLCRGPADCVAADFSGLCPSGCACGNSSRVSRGWAN